MAPPIFSLFEQAGLCVILDRITAQQKRREYDAGALSLIELSFKENPASGSQPVGLHLPASWLLCKCR
jgi:hypothetical protein